MAFTVALECDEQRVKDVAKDSFGSNLTDTQATEILESMNEPDADERFDEYIADVISEWMDKESPEAQEEV